MRLVGIRALVKKFYSIDNEKKLKDGKEMEWEAKSHMASHNSLLVFIPHGIGLTLGPLDYCGKDESDFQNKS